MRYFRVSPEVPFGLGDQAEFNEDPHSWVDGVKPFVTIDLVLYELPVPDFSTIHPVYLATPRLADALKVFSGLRQRSYTLAFDEQMQELGEFDGKDVPPLACYEIDGVLGESDFVYDAGVAYLLVSERAVAVLEEFNLGPLATVAPYEP